MERLLLLRNLGYGGAAASLVILVQLVQVGAKDFSLQLTVLALSVALPLWLSLGATYEFYIFLGKQSYPHLRTKFAKSFFGLIMFVAGIALVVAIGGIFWYLLPDAVWVYAVTSVLCVALVAVFNVLLARWWFGVGGPGSTEPEEEG